MNICIFNGDMSRGGGTERMAAILANCLCGEADFRVSVLSLLNPEGRCSFPLRTGIRHAVLCESPCGLVRKNWRLLGFLREEKIDVLINVDVMLGLYSFAAVWLSRRTRLVSWEMFNIRNDIGSRHTRSVRRMALRLSSYYVCLTRRDMEAFRREMPVRCPIGYVYNPCVRHDQGNVYNEDSRIIITAGHFFRTKGYDLAVEVARLVFRSHPEWTWEFYGDGPQMENVRERVRECGLERNVLFRGRADDMDSVYGRAALYVMTSRTEGFGLVLTEAKAAGLPTLAFDVEFGPGEIIQDNVSGYLVKPFETRVMAERIIYLIEHPERRREFSRHATDNLDGFSLDSFREAWRRILEQCRKA